MAYNTEYNGKKSYISNQRDDDEDSQSKIVSKNVLFLFISIKFQ